MQVLAQTKKRGSVSQVLFSPLDKDKAQLHLCRFAATLPHLCVCVLYRLSVSSCAWFLIIGIFFFCCSLFSQKYILLHQRQLPAFLNSSKLLPVGVQIKMFWCRVHLFPEMAHLATDFSAYLLPSHLCSSCGWIRIRIATWNAAELLASPCAPPMAGPSHRAASTSEPSAVTPSWRSAEGHAKVRSWVTLHRCLMLSNAQRGVTVETCGLNSFQHNWFFEWWEDKWVWHCRSGGLTAACMVL